MKRVRVLLLIHLLCLDCGTAIRILFAQNSNPKSALERVEEEVGKRRRMRDGALSTGLFGGVFQPAPNGASESVTFEINARPLLDCGQPYATLTGKEVMISGRVTANTISVSAQKLSRSEAVARMTASFEAAGIAIVPVGSSILVLVDAKVLPKK
jgi:hypothetical protein